MVANPEALKMRAYGAALEAIQNRYGGLAAVKAEAFQLTTTPSQIVPFDAERIFLAIINLSGDYVMVCPDTNVSTTRGFKLSPNGGAASFNEKEDTMMPCMEYWGQGLAINLDCFRVTVRRDVDTGQTVTG